MKLIMLLIVLSLAPALAQRDSVKVQLGEGETTCPTGWTAVDRTWTKPARNILRLTRESGRRLSTHWGDAGQHSGNTGVRHGGLADGRSGGSRLCVWATSF